MASKDMGLSPASIFLTMRWSLTGGETSAANALDAVPSARTDAKARNACLIFNFGDSLIFEAHSEPVLCVASQAAQIGSWQVSREQSSRKGKGYVCSLHAYVYRTTTEPP